MLAGYAEPTSAAQAPMVTKAYGALKSFVIPAKAGIQGSFQ